MPEAQTDRTRKLREKRRRVELLLDPAGPEAQALDRLTAVHGSVAAAVKAALLAADGERSIPKVRFTAAGAEPVKKPGGAVKAVRQRMTEAAPEPTPPVLTRAPRSKAPHVQLGPTKPAPGSRLKGKK